MYSDKYTHEDPYRDVDMSNDSTSKCLICSICNIISIPFYYYQYLFHSSNMN